VSCFSVPESTLEQLRDELNSGQSILVAPEQVPNYLARFGVVVRQPTFGCVPFDSVVTEARQANLYQILYYGKPGSCVGGFYLDDKGTVCSAIIDKPPMDRTQLVRGFA